MNTYKEYTFGDDYTTGNNIFAWIESRSVAVFLVSCVVNSRSNRVALIYHKELIIIIIIIYYYFFLG